MTSRAKYAQISRIHHIDPVCVECGGRGKITPGNRLFPADSHRAAMVFFRCDCGAFASCHPGTAIPCARPANGHTRYLRHKAHEAFDPLWMGYGSGSGRTKGVATGKARKRAYRWLAQEMGLEIQDMHIGLLNADQCRRVIELCTQRAQRRAAA
jgi:hypothetical protein